MTYERHPCPCRECPCTSTSSVRGNACPNCTAGAHRPPQHVLDHLAAGQDQWLKAVPISMGSSGLSDKQLAQAGESWLAWHRQSHCPIEWEASPG